MTRRLPDFPRGRGPTELSSGEHDDWDEVEASFASERRSMVRFCPTRAYGMLDLAAPDDG